MSLLCFISNLFYTLIFDLVDELKIQTPKRIFRLVGTEHLFSGSYGSVKGQQRLFRKGPIKQIFGISGTSRVSIVYFFLCFFPVTH